MTDDRPFLDPHPPLLVARGLAVLIVVGSIATLFAAATIRVPDAVRATFVVMPVGGPAVVQTPVRGSITESFVLEGQRVSRAEALFIMRSEPAADRNAELANAMSRRAVITQRLEHEAWLYADGRGRNEEVRRSLERRIELNARLAALKRRQLDNAREIAHRIREGASRGVFSTIDALTRESEADRQAEELEIAAQERLLLEAAQAEVVAAMRRDSADHAQLQRTLRQDAAELDIRIEALAATTPATAGATLTIIAPCSGTAVGIAPPPPGTFVPEGGTLAEIACDSVPLHAELTLPERGSGRVAAGQPVRLLFDAFPYQTYGALGGVVSWTRAAAVHETARGDRTGMRALVTLSDTPAFLVDGRHRGIEAGMTGAARVITGRRTLMSHVLSPLRQLRENVSGGRDTR